MDESSQTGGKLFCTGCSLFALSRFLVYYLSHFWRVCSTQWWDKVLHKTNGGENPQEPLWSKTIIEYNDRYSLYTHDTWISCCARIPAYQMLYPKKGGKKTILKVSSIMTVIKACSLNFLPHSQRESNMFVMERNWLFTYVCFKNYGTWYDPVSHWLSIYLLFVCRYYTAGLTVKLPQQLL